MTVNKGDYGNKRSGGPVMVNIRLSPNDGHTATKRELGEVLDSIIERGTVPRGWKFAGIEWKNPAKASSGWRRGDINELDAFRPVLAEIGKTKLLEQFRAAEVASRQPTAKQLAAIRKAEGTRNKANAELGKAIKARDRSKLPETRRRWQKEAERAQRRSGKLTDRLVRLLDRIYGKPEYELAASYKPRKR